MNWCAYYRKYSRCSHLILKFHAAGLACNAYNARANEIIPKKGCFHCNVISNPYQL